MDAEQFKIFMKHQEKAQAELIASLQKMVVKQSTTPAAGSSAGPALPLPPPLELAGDMEANFEFFKQNWKNYASAAGMDVIGSAARQKYFNFELTVAETDNPELALAAIKEKVVRKRNKFVDWINFFGLSQDPDENIDDYLRKLKVLSKSCQFRALEKEMLRFKIVTSNKWSNLRTRMLGMQDLKEDAAVDMCRAEELVVTYGQVVGRTCDDVKKIRKKKECKFCGDWHEFEKGVCPAFGKRCNHCGRKNHFERVCKSDRRKQSKSKRKVHKVHRDSLEDNSEESDSIESSSGSEASAVIGKIENSLELGGNVTTELDFCVDARACKVLKLVQFCDTVSESSSQSEEPVLEINQIRDFRRGGRSGETGEDHLQLFQNQPCVCCRARCWHPA
ncbi:tetratricopeptide repeat protein, tpr [Culex quinquefasciatus]|uniref:Tetratricopeptide repeat protein, tpr n=1 Tax=Culex quinquefasciatus TaxID=7176 RepID=B0W9D5_CULQU|nr:tetratricopeptide repeat protein, tpr [Culex quinquefasciatus]|eukprot:XP_001845319.1 tetratricopeptide repeat protein, tpr [Culex quinquefasciatus]